MRWVNSWLAAALCLGLCACGDYSTEDLRFLAAVPSRADLRVEVPEDAPGDPGVARQVVCATRPADTWLRAKPESDRLNAAVEFLLGLVDVVRRAPPDWRAEDARGWGPFPDAKHPGRETRVTILRTLPGRPGGAAGVRLRVRGARDGRRRVDDRARRHVRGRFRLAGEGDALPRLRRALDARDGRRGARRAGAWGSSTTAPRSR